MGKKSSDEILKMENRKPNLSWHPFVSRWMKNNGLIARDTHTEIGYVARLPNSFWPESFMYSFENIDRMTHLKVSNLQKNRKKVLMVCWLRY